MAIAQVRAQINGAWHTLTLNPSTGKYEATITAPGVTSYNQSGGYYNVSVEATNTAGTTATADASTLDGLKLYVKEKVAPVITIVSPTNGASVTNNRQPVVFTVTDEAGGSGVNPDSITVRQDSAAADAQAITKAPITNGYQCTYTPEDALSDGNHTVYINARDNDGNTAAQKSTAYKVDTVPPALNVTSPTDELVTAAASLTVAGITNDATSSPVTVAIKLNGADQGAVSVGTNGAFSKVVTLTEGENTIVITATDSAGKTTSVTRTVTLDTSVPVISAATITPNPASAGATMILSVTITEG